MCSIFEGERTEWDQGRRGERAGDVANMDKGRVMCV